MNIRFSVNLIRLEFLLCEPLCDLAAIVLSHLNTSAKMARF